MPGSYGYTGQHADATTGLDDYNARYYDASAGQFASADTAQDVLNRYGYVHGNPTTASDPNGHGAGQCIIDAGVYYCPPQPPAPPPCTHNCGGGDGGHEAPPGKVDNSIDSGLCGPQKDNLKNPNCYVNDKGQCADQYTCNVEQQDALKKADNDQVIGKLLILFSSFVSLLTDVAASNVQKGIEDALKLVGVIDDYLIPAFGWFFGNDSGMVAAAKQIVGVANTFAGVVAGLDGVLWAAGMLMTALHIFTGGPVAVLLEKLIFAGIGSISLLGTAYGYFLMQQGKDEKDQASGTTYQWCEHNPGSCSSSINWNI